MGKKTKKFLIICGIVVGAGLLLTIIGAAAGGISSIDKLATRYTWIAGPAEEEQQQTAATFDISEKQRQKQQNKITPINRNRRQGQPGMEVCVIKPTTIEDEIEITETLLNGRTVVINMEGLSVDIAQRIIDFTSGATFAMHGNLQKISNYIFLATPNGVDISGDIQGLMESFDLPGLN